MLACLRPIMSKLPKFTPVVLAICLFTRLFLFIIAEPWMPSNVEEVILQYDAVGYHALAVTLTNHAQFALEEDGEPEALRTPCYPLYVSLFYSIFGEKPWIVLLSQVVMDVISCMLLITLVAQALNPEIALYAGLFYALDPHLVLYSNHLLSETLFVFLCILFFYFFWNAISKEVKRDQIVCLSCSAFLLGMATLVRPVSQSLLLVLLIIILIFVREGIKERLKRVVVFAMVFVFSLSPWLIRNYITFNVLSLSSSANYNLLVLHVASFETERRGLQDKLITQDLLRSEASDLMREDGLNPDNLRPYGFIATGYYRNLGIQYIKNYPGYFIKHYVTGILHFFLELDTPNYARYFHIPVTGFYLKGHPNIFILMRDWFTQKTLAEVAMGVCIGLYLVACYTCVAIGVFAARSNRCDRAFLCCCAAVTLYFALITGSAGWARFRVPAVPFYLSFAGIGVVSLKSSGEKWLEGVKSRLRAA